MLSNRSSLVVAPHKHIPVFEEQSLCGSSLGYIYMFFPHFYSVDLSTAWVIPPIKVFIIIIIIFIAISRNALPFGFLSL